jgi:hypothetical protein
MTRYRVRHARFPNHTHSRGASSSACRYPTASLWVAAARRGKVANMEYIRDDT